MGELLARAGASQLAISETHKFGHVTYFWNGNRSEPFDPSLETYVEIPSDLTPLEQRPWMKAAEITDRLIAELDRAPRFVRVNYANGDMVGHTGDLHATILAVEAVDLCLARLVAAIRKRKGVAVITADHGNADQMFDRRPDGALQVRTSHTLNRVPFAIVDPREPGGGPRMAPGPAPGLSNVAATCLELLGYTAAGELPGEPAGAGLSGNCRGGTRRILCWRTLFVAAASGEKSAGAPTPAGDFTGRAGFDTVRADVAAPPVHEVRPVRPVAGLVGRSRADGV
jgi:bisphosphoglycerate-independent phosphoglycerate mutase (AlkP superfamily)